MPKHLLALADARHIPLRDGCAHTCVTSIPYWGLRDYGTGEWIGGDPDCAHRGVNLRPDHSGSTMHGTRGEQPATSDSSTPYLEACGKCGAVRRDQQIGLEPSPEAYVETIVGVFREVWRVLRDDGTLWLNIGDSYATKPMGLGSTHDPKYPNGRNRRGPSSNRSNRIGEMGLKHKDLVGIPWRVALALQQAGWYLRCDVIWSKPNVMPESVYDRPSKSHEYLFLLTKRQRYYYDATAVMDPVSGTANGRGNGVNPKAKPAGPNSRAHANRVPGPRNGRGVKQNTSFSAAVANPVATRHKRSVWSIPTEPFPGAHFATFPRRLVEPCILAGTSAAGCCPECGAPWVRETETAYENPGNRTTNGQRSIDRKHIEFGTAGYEVRLEKRVRTVGWKSSCRCPAHVPVPCTVFDPFGGAGTVSVVAEALGRNSIYTDLKPEYLAMARRRLERPHAALAAVPADDEESEQGPGPLFERLG